jgi:curli biogenesis system outer membrane secretion channel CsgG
MIAGIRSAVMAGVFLLASVILSGCVSTEPKATVTSGQGSPSIQEVQAEAYNGPKARIAVARFKDKTGKGWWTGQIGDGMADQLTTALFNTGRYIVLERQTLSDVLQEQDLGASGRIRQDTAAPIGQIEGAELLIVGAVTEFEGNASGARGGIGGIGRGIFGGIVGGFKKAHMAIDLRVIDTRTSRIVAATSVEGEATDVNMGALLGGWGSAGALAGGLSGWKNTPIEKALRICIKKAVEFIVSKTPQRYYHYSEQAAPQPATVSAPAQPAASAPPASASSEIVSVKVNSLNVRSGPGKNYSVIFTARRGERLTVLERSGDWIRVRSANGKEGWTAGWLTVPAR